MNTPKLIRNKEKLTFWNRKKHKLKDRAKKKGLIFELSSENVKHLRTSPCVYCGSLNAIMTIDRKDNSLGYTLGNSVSACYQCNTFKGFILSFQEMQRIGIAIRKVKRHNPLFWNWSPYGK